MAAVAARKILEVEGNVALTNRVPSNKWVLLAPVRACSLSASVNKTISSARSRRRAKV
jgi:hypothetical protein